MAQTNWTSLGKPEPQTSYPSAPTVGRNADGRLEVFLYGLDGTLWHIWQTAPGSGWSNWSSLNMPDKTSTTLSPIAIGENVDGRLEIFTVISDETLWHIWQTAPGSGWSNWSSFGRPSSSVGQFYDYSLCVESNTNGRLEVFTKGTDGALWHLYQLTPNGNWGSWTSLEKPLNTNIGGLGTCKNADGRIEVFTKGDDGNLWHIWQTAPGGGWSNWFSSGKPANGVPGTPIVSRNLDGRLEVFTIASDGELYHIWQHTPGGTWGGWFSLGNPTSANMIGDCSVTQNKDGHLELVVNTDDGALWHIWQTDSGKSWGMWYSLGRPTSTTTSVYAFLIANADGRLEAFTSSQSEGSLWHTWQVTPGGNWG